MRYYELTIDDLLFVGFNRRVAGVHRDTGEVIWDWKAPRGAGLPTLMMDGDRLMVSVQGYTYCLDPMNGKQRWQQDFKGFGVGTASLASVRGHSMTPPAEHAQKQQQAAHAGGAAAV